MKRLYIVLFVFTLSLPIHTHASEYVLKMTDEIFPPESNYGFNTLLEDEEYTFVFLPFQFPFYCGQYDFIFIHTNGILTLGDRTTHSGLFLNDLLPYMALDYPELTDIPVISPYWTDVITSHACLDGDSSFYYDGDPTNIDNQDNCYYVLRYEEVFGSPGSERNGSVWYRVDEGSTPRRLIVTWENVFHWVGYNDLADPPVMYGDPNTSGNSYQVILYEDGRIQFNYGAMGWTGYNTNGYDATVGAASGNSSGLCNGMSGSTPAYEYYPTDTIDSGTGLHQLVNKRLLYLFDADEDNIPDDGDASGLMGDNPCQFIANPPTHHYNPPVAINCDDNCPDVVNPDQNDCDNDGIGDACDLISLCGPDGDLDVSGSVDVADILIAMRIAAGLITPTTVHLQHGDVSPLGNPDGVIDISDVLMVARKASGLTTF